MTSPMLKEHEEHFAEEDEWVAALVRQHFRSMLAQDSKAREVSLFYLKCYLCNLLGSHLHLSKDQRWISRNGWLDGLGGAEPACKDSTRFALRDYMTWATRGHKDWYVEPFEFEIELTQPYGDLKSYTLRFADHRPLGEKKEPSGCETFSAVGPGDIGWVFVYHRGESSKTEDQTYDLPHIIKTSPP